MILVAIDFTENNLTHTSEHSIAESIRDYLIRNYIKNDGEFEFLRHETGKPFIANSDITYSLSHTNGCIGCAFCVDNILSNVPRLPSVVSSSGVYVLQSNFPCEIGLDIEVCDTSRTKERMDAIATRYYSEGEKNRLFEAEDSFSVFYSIWTRKESYVKCTGEGMKAITSIDTANLPRGCEMFEFMLKNGNNTFAASVCLMEKVFLDNKL
ncbi:MAG: 4'-phosphopantetheinyl transferase superfamily protein [Clostridia bacterium]|nr:4'-phosphopantetheinyl transferase superfamily protein [Clostridia bacterium]